MKEINLGSNISIKRKEKGLTQEELSEFLGVSKAAVSKWESGHSYPDITLLPVLATYFNTSVDEIMGYEPQMLKTEISKLYLEFTKAFASKPFDEVYIDCHNIARKYYSCWNLQLHIGLLFINHANLAGSMEKAEAVLYEAIKVFDHIIDESNDTSFTRKAIQMKSLCYIALNKPVETIDLLEDIIESPMMSPELLLAQAYQMKGDSDKAKCQLQGSLFLNMMSMIEALTKLMSLNSNDPLKADSCYQKIAGLGDIFEIYTLSPSAFLLIYLTAAQLFLQQNNQDGALNMVQKYVELCCSPGLFPLKLKGNEFFDHLDDYMSSLDITTEPPRNEKVIKQSMKDAIVNNPFFEPLQSDERFLALVERLNKI